MRPRFRIPPSLVREHKLLASPVPFWDESPSSWVQRICGAHQYTMTTLLSVLKMPPKFRDFDCDISSRDWEELLLLSEMGTRPCWRAIEAVVASELHYGFFWLTGRGSAPIYRWCPQCFASDHIPYLRWWWRFYNAKHCPYHGCSLLANCHWCGKPLVLPRAILTKTGPWRAVDTLAHCQDCGMPRYDPLSIPYGNDLKQTSVGHAFRDAVKLLINSDGELKLNFYVEDGVVREAPINRSRTITSWNYNGLRFFREMRISHVRSFPFDWSGKVLHLRGKDFEPPEERPYISVSRGRLRYFPKHRSRLAYAMRVFRDEIRAQGILPVGHYMGLIQEELEREGD